MQIKCISCNQFFHTIYVAALCNECKKIKKIKQENKVTTIKNNSRPLSFDYNDHEDNIMNGLFIGELCYLLDEGE